MSFVTDHTRIGKGKPIEIGAKILTIILAVFIAVQSLAPASGMSGPIYSDKIVHAIAYFTLTLIALFGWPKTGKMKIALLCFVLGTAIEFIQGILIAGRTGSMWDGTANLAGIVLAVFLFRLVRRNSPVTEGPKI